MSAVYLEKISLPKVVKHGVELASFVPEETWLADVLPGTLERYRDMPHAIKNAGRVAINRGTKGFIIRKDRNEEAMGIATIVFGQTVEAADGTQHTGNNLDYWLRSRFAESEFRHRSVAAAVLEASARYSGDEHFVFATTPTAHPYNRGLAAAMPRQDGVQFVPPETGDTYGVGWDPATVEFHGKQLQIARFACGQAKPEH